MRSTTARAASMRARASAETSTCRRCRATSPITWRSEEHTSELQSRLHLVCRLLLEKKKGDAGIKSAIQGSNVPNPDEAVPSFVSGAMAKAGKGLLEGTLQAGTSAVSDKLLDLVGLGGKSAADKGKDTRDYLAAAFS